MKHPDHSTDSSSTISQFVVSIKLKHCRTPTIWTIHFRFMNFAGPCYDSDLQVRSSSRVKSSVETGLAVITPPGYIWGLYIGVIQEVYRGYIRAVI